MLALQTNNLSVSFNYGWIEIHLCREACCFGGKFADDLIDTSRFQPATKKGFTFR